MRFAAAVAALVLVSSPAIAAEALQWTVSAGGNGHWYALAPAPMTLSQATAYAASRGAYLATVRSLQEQQFVAALPGMAALGCDGPRIGLVQAPGTVNPAAGWSWQTGESLSYTNWAAGEPNDFQGQNEASASLYCGPDRKWNDVRDSLALPAVIEWSADCNNDGIVDYGQIRIGALPDYDGNDIPDCCEDGVPCAVGSYPVEWRAADGGNGHWYRFVEADTNYEVARAAALAQGAHLATIGAQSETQFVAGLAGIATLDCDGPRIGLVQAPNTASPTANWSWDNGEPLTYLDWAPGEPNDFQGVNETSAGLYCAPARKWNDVPMSRPMPSLIEWSDDCDGDGQIDYGQVVRGEVVDGNGDGVPDSCQTVFVPKDYLTIQAAINSFGTGEYGIVQVSAGTRTESFSLNGKNVRVRGAANGGTIVDGTGLSTSVVRFAGGEPASAGIEGLVIRNGTAGTTINPPAPVTVG
ncbi:MAG: lectin-like protein, partial [Planctomycetota bacterium]